MKLNCVIVDDEQGAQLILENYISRLDYLALCGKFSNAIDAYHYLKSNKADVLLLDINMPEVDGFGLVDMLEHKPVVIFTTAYSDYALKGFEYNAVDYLHKPIRFERFVIAIEKARKWNSVQQAPTGTVEFLDLKIDGITRHIRISDIGYLESLGNYVKIHAGRDTAMVLSTMSDMEDKLTDQFVRIHKSYLVNAANIQKIRVDEIVVANTSLPIGKTYKKYFAEFMKNKV